MKMMILEVLFELVLYIAEAFIIMYYAKTLFVPRFGSRVYIPYILLGHLVLFAAHQFDRALLNVALIIVVNSIIFWRLFSASLREAFFHAAVLTATMFMCEFAMMLLTSALLKCEFNAYQGDFGIYVLNIVTGKLLYAAVCWMLARMLSSRKKGYQSKSVYWILMLMPLSSIFMLLVVRYIIYDIQLPVWSGVFCSLASVFLLLTNIVIFFVYEHALQTADALSSLKMAQQEEAFNRSYYDLMDQTNRDLEILAHDMKNHLIQISNMSDSSEIQAYISSIYGPIERFDYMRTSQNHILDMICSRYASACERKGVFFHFTAQTANLTYMADQDLSALMNNLLDNAVEAAVQSEKKDIHVDIYDKNGFFDVITIRNSCNVQPKNKGNRLLTTKRERHLHGIGSASIQQIVRKYQGVYDWTYTEQTHTFQTTIALPKSILDDVGSDL